jgi:hypothetical protein
MRKSPLPPIAALLLLAVASVGCGKEAGRLPFTGEGVQSASVELAAGEVAFWTDLDVQYDGAATLAYTITLSQGGAPVATAACNPLGRLPVKMGWVETNVNGAQSRKGSGKMECSATLAKGGPTTVQATLAFAQRPATVTLNKADLVLKQ